MEIVSPEKGIIRKKVIFEVDKYTFMPMYVLEPEGNFSRLYYAFAGHQGGGKESVAGVREIKEISEKIDFFNYDYGLKLARKGFTVICPDPRGFGERRDASAQGDNAAVLSCSCRNISNMAIPLGLSVIGLLAYDYMRLTDYLEASGKYDISELSCIGFSGGGMQTLFLSAVDRRIKRALISGYMYGVKDALLLLNNNCNCNYVPGLWEHFDMGDIGALLAPIPLVIQSCRDDHLNGERGLENVYEQLEIIKKAYKLMKAEKMLIHDIRPGGHHFHDEILTADLLSDKG
ncbi:MAG: alpha/beta hydrolase family protein [Lachnospiraceae bacterium]|nr:alpha/beta hydrolase family protein [Lachnospiraceae bacterium]